MNSKVYRYVIDWMMRMIDYDDWWMKNESIIINHHQPMESREYKTAQAQFLFAMMMIRSSSLKIMYDYNNIVLVPVPYR